MTKIHGLSRFDMTRTTSLVQASSSTVAGVTTITYTDGSILTARTTRMGDVASFADATGHDLFSITGTSLATGQTAAAALAEHGNLARLFADALRGADRIAGSHEADVIRGFDGNDSINGESGNDLILGDGGNDSLKGSTGNDTLAGGDGDDQLIGGVGADLIDGGAGSDTASFAGLAARMTVDLSLGMAVRGRGEVDRLIGIENVVTDRGNDRIGGDGAANVLRAGAGADDLTGRGGDDLLDGQAGDDRLVGGSGADSFVLAADGGRDTVRDFEDGVDRVLVRGAAGLDGLVITDSAAGAEIRHGGGVLVLTGIAAGALSADDFTFA